MKNHKPSQYYLPEKYNIITGDLENQNNSIALCTCWSDPEIITKEHPELKQQFAIIGSLYSIEGISIIIRNLLLNPNIQYVLVWANNKLSNTEIGKRGWNNLLDLWKQKKVDNTFLHKEIDKDAILELINNVKIMDVSKHSIDKIKKLIKENKFPQKNLIRKPLSFPIRTRETNEAFPSEEMGWLIRERKVVDAWLKVVDKIDRYGQITETEYGSKQKSLQAVTWVIENEDINKPFVPDWPIELKNQIGLSQNSIQKYADYFLDSQLPHGVSYTYGQRLRNYPLNKEIKLDQIDKIIAKLKDNITTRRAIAITIDPKIDFDSKNPPCLNQIQILEKNNKLNLIALFRSQDIFKAGIVNAFGLLHLQDYVCKHTGLKPSKLTISSNSAHIYEEEWKSAEDIVKCQIRKQPIIEFDPIFDADPRGVVKIDLVDNKISFVLNSYNGKELISFNGTSAEEIMKQILKRDLLSKPSHYSYIAMELKKAEIAFKFGIDYTQDKELY